MKKPVKQTVNNAEAQKEAKAIKKFANKRVKEVINQTVQKVIKKSKAPAKTSLGKEVAALVKQVTEAPKPKHIVVMAYAGTGKTFTEIVGVPWALVPDLWPQVQRGIAQRKGLDPKTFKIVPSPEQEAVWKEFALSKGVATVQYCAFNKSIVTQFNEEWGWMQKLLQEAGITLTFNTVNGLGHSTCYRAFGRITPSNKHTENLISEALGVNIWDLRRTEPIMVPAVRDLVGHCKLTMAGWTEEGGFSPSNITHEELDALVDRHEIPTAGCRSQVYDLVPQIMEASLDVVRSHEISFDDQNWLPIVLKLPVTQSELLLVDESQDLPRCKQEYVRLAGKRICLVGDVNQAIYGFAGADTDSIPRMQKLLGDVTVCKLTETRRCGKAIVAEAQKLVPDFKAHESNPEGLVRKTVLSKYMADVRDADMCLCRVNAPLISQALRFIKDGRKAIVRGREFGTNLIKFVEGFKATTVPELVEKLEKWYDAEIATESKKKHPSENKLISMADKKDCIISFCEGVAHVVEVIQRINLVFAGKECPKCRKRFAEEVVDCFACKVPLVQPKGILFSSIHKAKGLEADRVFILDLKGASIPHPMAKSDWAKKQEYNLKYVAITRAIHELVWVND